MIKGIIKWRFTDLMESLSPIVCVPSAFVINNICTCRSVVMKCVLVIQLNVIFDPNDGYEINMSFCYARKNNIMKTLLCFHYSDHNYSQHSYETSISLFFIF